MQHWLQNAVPQPNRHISLYARLQAIEAAGVDAKPESAQGNDVQTAGADRSNDVAAGHRQPD